LFEGGDSEVDETLAVRALVGLGELVLGVDKADFEALDFVQPAFVFGFGCAGEQVVADLGDARALGGVGSVHAAS
jgi:hypothetical protein